MRKLSYLLLSMILIITTQLLTPAQKNSAQKRMNVAIFVFDEVQIIDYTGPYEVLGEARSWTSTGAPFKVYTVSEKSGPITTSMGMSVNPTYNFENSPKPDILIIPGGGGLNPNSPGVSAQVKNPAVIKWVQDNARDAKIVMSVCNGAFIVAQAGLLDGLEATTTAGGYIDGLRKQFPKIKNVVDDRRFVDNGKVITTAGLSSGIDGSLHIIEKLLGRTSAKTTALGIEYNWDPDSKYARAALAEKYIPQSVYGAFYTNETDYLDFNGDTDKWEEKYSTPSTMSPSEMIEKIDQKLVVEANWTKTNKKAKNTLNSTSLWKFTDDKGRAWTATTTVQPAAKKNQLLITLKISRAA